MNQDLMIEKTLTDSDLSSNSRLRLPKKKVENIIKSTGVPVPRNGIQVEIVDGNKSYWVNLGQDVVGYFIGNGWQSLRDARQLQKGNIIKLYWQKTKFIFSM
ncbi:hypothetical protein CARUB_v10002744mg [Capsella rubella]|uniref:TF-B3 domain-containing protein n=1 Tax=Capsella rubella TaxID=81985 RepID=R0HEH1_9BRAS|nr:B3 domain-containing protein At1g08985 [Capsella rubella]EOA22173.1 hypothetical protein CARUB_v10002744mg [Capsella rubella]